MKPSIPKASFIILSFFLFFSCTSTSKMASSERDGLSFETAIIAKSVSFEYEWIRENYPGSQPQTQALVFEKKKPFDIITIKTASGETIDIHFDISKFYGKGF